MQPIPMTWEQVAVLLRYDPVTGAFQWRPRAPSMFPGTSKSREHECAVWNAKYAGKTAGRVNASTGYVEISLLGRRFQAHRIAVLLDTGEWPPHMVDHINGVRADNRASNLRCVLPRLNNQNAAAHRDSSSRHVGVSWDSARQKWVASITANGRKRNLGRFQTEEDAAAAYRAAKATVHQLPWRRA